MLSVPVCMKRESRFPLILLLALLVVAAGGFFWLAGRPERSARQEISTAGPLSTPSFPVGEAQTVASVEQGPAASTGALPTPPAGGKSQRQAYRFALRGGKISLEGVDLLQGDFHKRRGPMAWRPGMWCVRFLDADMRVLAQETAPAPDEPCVVLDPNVLNASGNPQVSQLKLTDDVMMQMRVPPVSGAAWIKIYRIASAQPAAWDVEPMGQLLASIPLPP